MAVNVPLSKGRFPAPVPVASEMDGDGSLAEVMHEVGVALAADSLVVGWHERDEEPVLLYTDGVTADGEAERSLEGTAGFAADGRSGGARTEWRVGEDAASGGELLTSIPTEAGVVTISGRFNRLGTATRTRARDAAARLLPVVQPFLRLWATRQAVLSRVRGLTAAVNKSDVGIVLVNRHGKLLFANTAAEALIAQGDGVRRQGQMLSGGRLADTLKLQAAIEHVISGGENDGRNVPAPVVALSRKARRPLLAAVVGSETPGTQAEESAAIVYLCDPDQDLTRLVEPACRLYGLSPVETRLACLLAGGISLAEAADAMRVREQTARSYLKPIFQKTGTNRQAELVGLMLKSSVRTQAVTRTRLI